MPNPAKSVELNSRHLTKEEKRTRKEAQDTLKGNADKIVPSDRLNANQKKIFNYIITELKNAGILGNVDTFLLEHTSIAIDRLQAIEKIINQDFEQVCNKDLMNAKTKYTRDFETGMNNLSISPQSRAKMGILAANKKLEEADPLLKVLKNKSG